MTELEARWEPLTFNQDCIHLIIVYHSLFMTVKIKVHQEQTKDFVKVTGLVEGCKEERSEEVN